MVDSSGGEQRPSDSEQGHQAVEDSQADPSPGESKAGLPGLVLGDAEMWRFAGAGMELGGAAILGAAVGYALDRYFENTTLLATAVGTVFGFASGLYRFIRMAMASNRSTGHR